ncbi:MFS transporter [Streptomyces microflavus]|uniref:MFS transporter n=1 Tax=Streptomyces microflavus TaxID=1919 RepID=UPI0036605CB0
MTVNTRVLIACGMGLFLGSANTAFSALALPELTSSLRLSGTASAWTVMAYQLPAGAMLLTAGNLGDRWGHRRLYLAGLLLFATASVLCAAAAGAPQLLSARALQGVGGAVLTPATMALVVLTHPEPGDRTRAIALWTAGMGAGAAAGPTIGSLMLAGTGWRGLFAATATIALAAAALAYCVLPRTSSTQTGPLDIVGQSLLTLALGAVLYAITCFQRLPPSPYELVSAGVLFSAAVSARRGRARRRSTAATDPAGPAAPGLRPAMALGCALFVLFNGFTYFHAVYLQRSAGLDPLQAGALMTPAAVALFVAAPAAGRLAIRFGLRATAAGGAAAVVVGSVAFAMVLPAGPGLSQIAASALIGAGTGLVNSVVGATVAITIPTDQIGAATGQLASARMFGGAAGMALLSSVLADGYRQALLDSGAALTGEQLSQALMTPPMVRPAAIQLTVPTTTAFDSGLMRGILACSALLLSVAVVACRRLPEGTGTAGRRGRRRPR